MSRERLRASTILRCWPTEPSGKVHVVTRRGRRRWSRRPIVGPISEGARDRRFGLRARRGLSRRGCRHCHRTQHGEAVAEARHRLRPRRPCSSARLRMGVPELARRAGDRPNSDAGSLRQNSTARPATSRIEPISGCFSAGICPRGLIHFARRCTAVREDGERVELEFKSAHGGHHRAWADAAIAADGIRSALRQTVTVEDSPRFSGLCAYRCLVPGRARARDGA